MKIGKNLPKPAAPAVETPAARAEKDARVAELVAAAGTAPEAWEALGERTKGRAEKARDARAQMLADALLERLSRVKRGRQIVSERRAAGQPVGAAIAARFKELHRERLLLAWKLDAATFKNAAVDRHRIAALCDEEVSVALGQEWHGPAVQAALRTVNDALLVADLENFEDPLPAACFEALDACVDQLYGGES